MQYPTDTRFIVEVNHRFESRNEPVALTYPIEGWKVDSNGCLVPVYDEGKTYHDEPPQNWVTLAVLP